MSPLSPAKQTGLIPLYDFILRSYTSHCNQTENHGRPASHVSKGFGNTQSAMIISFHQRAALILEISFTSKLELFLVESTR